MLSAFKDTCIELLGSKKFLILLATVLAAGAAKIGWHVDASTLLPYLGLAASAILAQGIADHGKGAAEVTANAAAAPPAAAPSAPPKPNGFIALRLLLLLPLLAALALLACTNSSCGARTKAAEQAYIDCLEDHVKAEVPNLLPTIEVIIASGGANWQAQLEAIGVAYGKDALACTVQAAAVEFGSKVGAGSGAAAPDAAAKAQDFIRAHGWVYRP